MPIISKKAHFLTGMLVFGTATAVSMKVSKHAKNHRLSPSSLSFGIPFLLHFSLFLCDADVLSVLSIACVSVLFSILCSSCVDHVLTLVILFRCSLRWSARATASSATRSTSRSSSPSQCSSQCRSLCPSRQFSTQRRRKTLNTNLSLTLSKTQYATMKQYCRGVVLLMLFTLIPRRRVNLTFLLPFFFFS